MASDLPITPTVLAPDNKTNSTSTHTYVDYVPPPVANLEPPAKYKLWVLVLILVYFANWFSAKANVVGAFGALGWLSPNASLFLTLAIVVFVLVFASLDLTVALFTFKIKKRSYGIGPWLKKPRTKWVHRHECFVIECLACVVVILEDGFSMFDAPKGPISRPEEDLQEFSCANGYCDVVLKIEHRVDPSKMKEYHEWGRKIDRAAAYYARGLKDVKKSTIVHEDTVDEERGEKGEERPSQLAREGCLQVIYLTFANIVALNEWMASPTRQKLIKELKPLLKAEDIVQIRENRALPDAFTDLLIRQGEPVPVLLPKKWKVWWLTLLGLFVTQLWTKATLPYYFDQWKLTNAHPRLQAFVNVSISTFLNAYVLTPLLLFLFSSWVQRKKSEKDEREPWRTLNDGIQSKWLKALLTVAMYGGFAAAWAVKASNSSGN